MKTEMHDVMVGVADAVSPFSEDERMIIDAHRVGGRSIVPAALVIARMLERFDSARNAVSFENLMFHAPIHPCDRIDVSERLDEAGRMHYAIRRGAAGGSEGTIMEGTGELLREWSGAKLLTQAFLPADEPADETLDADSFYAALEADGNDFREPLRLVRHGRRHGERLHFTIASAGAPLAATLDACLHALLALRKRGGCPTAIGSIGRVEIARGLRPPEHVYANLREHTEDGGFIADLIASDSSGNVVARFYAVQYHAYVLPASPTLAIAGNITLEPLQEAYDYLAQPLGLCAQVTPYDQIHQILLSGNGPANTETTRELLLVLDLTQWDTPDPLHKDEAYRRAIAAGGSPAPLPNGTEVVSVNRYEMDHLYEEIFDRRTYLTGGVAIKPGDTVLDIGANIGLFSLHVLDLCPDARILAFEPSPVTAALLKANVEGRGNVIVCQVGVAEAPGRAMFTHYDTSTVFSGFHVDPVEDRRTIERVIKNRLAREVDAPDADAYVQELIADRLLARQLEVETTSVSHVIDKHDLDRVGLLKIDAEKSEDAILRGIGDEHWPLIRQVVLEIHDSGTERLARIRTFMEEKGFRISVHEQDDLRRAGLYSMTAVRHRAGWPPRIGRNYRTLCSHLDELRSALRAFREHSDVPVTVLFTASNAGSGTSAHVARQYRQAIGAFRRGLQGTSSVSVAVQKEIERLYPLPAVALTHGAVEDAGMPFGMSWYGVAAIWTLRRHLARFVSGKKAIIVDCDNTLWHGICAENGPRGVAVPDAYRRWQRFLRKQRKAGAILCLCSHNVPQDVDAVFDQHPDMVLSHDDIAVAKVGWKPKSELVAEIADELEFSPHSLVFVDDNPADCAEVAMAQPAVTCLTFPSNAADIDAFCRHTWVFDRLAPGDTGLDRTRMYKDEWRRKEFHKSRYSLEDFIDGLELEVTLRQADRRHSGRIVELTRRTTQFNLSGVMRDPTELDALLRHPQTAAWVVSVRDRFGDYGLTGAVYGEIRDGVFAVENFLLSCRVLGRGVEQRVAALLADEMEAAGLRRCRLQLKRTSKNVPAMRFFAAIAGEPSPPECIEVKPARLRGLPLRLAEKVEPQKEKRDGRLVDYALSPLEDRLRDPQLLDRIRMLSRDAGAIEKAVWGEIETTAEDDIGETPTERAVAALWRTILGRAPSTRNVDFFAAGGSSVQLVRLVSEIKRRYGIPLRLSEVYGGSSSLVALGLLIDQRAGNVARIKPLAQQIPHPILAPNQAGLWFLQNVDPQATTYNIPVAVCVNRQLDPQCIERQLQDVCRRHKVLASRYRLTGRQTSVFVDEHAFIPLEVLHGDAWTLPDIVDQCVERAGRVIDLARGPLVSATVMQISDRRSVLLMVTHHMVADLKSLEILIREVLDPELPPIDCPYAYWQFAARQQRMQVGEVGQALERYWRDELCELPAGLFSKARKGGFSPNDSGCEGLVRRYVDDVTLASLRECGREMGASLFMVLLTAKAVTIRQFFRKNDFIVGTPVSLRDDSEVDYSLAIGNFVNLIPIRFRINSDDYCEALENTKRSVETSMAHKEIPLYRLGNMTRYRPDRSPLVQAVFSFHSAESSIPISEVVNHGCLSRPFVLGGMECELLGIEQQLGQVDLGMECFECQKGLGINVKHSGSNFERERAVAFADHFVDLLLHVTSTTTT